MKGRASRSQAKDTFRQFAWHLAGTLATAKGGNNSGKPDGKRP